MAKNNHNTGLPAWVRKRDGRLVAFEADKVSQALFAATEAIGKPSAFLARELTDGVLHFLAQEAAAAEPTTDQIAELVAKVTRELGYPELAATFEQGREAAQNVDQAKPAPSQPTLAFSTQDRVEDIARKARLALAHHAIFTRDLNAAIEEELIQIDGLDHPDAADRLVIEPETLRTSLGARVLERMVQLRQEVGRLFILDGPDHWLAEDEAGAWLRQLGLVLEALDRVAVINLNVAAPPRWWREENAGPLFPGAAKTERSSRKVAGEIVAHLAARPLGHQRIVVDWHATDFDPARDAEDWRALVQASQCCRWVFDKSQQPICLAEGVDRAHPVALLEVGLNLSRFLTLPGIDGQVDRFLDKLPSLVNMAVSAGVQKRTFLARRLPRHAYLTQGFLLHRAQVVVATLGLDEVLQQLLGSAGAENKFALELEQRVMKTLRVSANQHGQARNVEIVLDAPFPCSFSTECPPPRSSELTPNSISELLRTAWRTEARRITMF